MIKTIQLNKKVGNKAKNLFLLKGLNINVPDFLVISYDELIQLLGNKEINESNIVKCEIPDEWINEITNSLKGIRSYAVRSSTEAEDSLNKSFAGQFKSKLNVQKHQLKDAIKEVWLSVFAKHIQTYDKLITQNSAISIIVQDCIEADRYYL